MFGRKERICFFSGDELKTHIPSCETSKNGRCNCVGVYFPESTKEEFRVLRAMAREWRNDGLACFINHANDVRLSFIPEVRLRGESCLMGPSITWRFVVGHPAAIAKVIAWR